MSILENKRSVRNGSVLGTSIGGTATAVAACFLPPGIIAVGAAYAGVGLFSAGMTYYGMKRLEESPQSERGESVSVPSNKISVANRLIRQ